MKHEVLQRIKMLIKLASYGIICQVLVTNTAIANNLSSQKDQQLSENIQVSGRVTDESNEALAGVNVIVMGTSTGTVTDVDGNYKIEIPENGVLIFSFVGYLKQEVNVNGRTTVDIVLKPDLTQLSEIVVIGYGETKKKDVTGSVVSVDAEQIDRRISVNPLDNLQGQVPGLNVTNASGRPGGGIRVTVRGNGSINGGNEPLYVIDGIIGADIELINTNDIENITVLKDASATAIYGFRAANGVVIITTKRGKAGEITVDLNYNLQIGRITNAPEVLDSERYWGELKPAIDQDLRNRGFDDSWFVDDYAASYPSLFNPGDDPVYGVPRFNTNWLDESSRTSISNQYFANIRGGGENFSASLSIGNQEDQGVMLNTSLDKSTLRLNGDYNVKEWLKVGGGISYAETETNVVDDYRVGADGLTYAALFYLPIYPTRYDDGSIVNADDLVRPNGQWDVWYGRTPSDRLNLLTREVNTTQMLRNFFIEIDILKNLKFRSDFAQEDIERDNNTHIPKELDTFVNRTSASVSNTESLATQWESTLNYTLVFGDNQTLNVLGGAGWYKTELFQFGAEARDFDDFFGFNNLSVGDAELNLVSSNYLESRANSFFGRVNYSYDDKYLLTATGRYDGSSRFGQRNEFAFFPSAAVAWRIDNENFLKGNNLVTNLKLRGSWGKTGNSGIGEFDRFGRPAIQNAIFGEAQINGTSQGTIGNDQLKWEITTETNVGLDIGLFNRLNITVDYYNRKSDDLLFGVPIASFSGYRNILGNAGSIRNRGIELLISSRIFETRDFTWDASVNFARNTNEILSLGLDDADLFRTIQWFPDQVFRVGESFGAFYGFNRLGTWNIGEEDQAAVYGAQPGDIRIEDVNGDEVIDSQDQMIIGNALPDFTMNFGSTVTYKNFTLAFDITASQGNEVMDYSVLLNVDRMGYGNTYEEFFDQAWTPENQNTMYPRVRRDLTFFRGMDSGHIFDASFIRGQNLSLSYDFTSSLIEKTGMRAARIYVNLQNWFLITDYHGYDPEASSYNGATEIGYELNAYPKSMITNIGIRASF